MASGDSSLFADVKNILLDKNFCHVKPLGTGSFGEVVSAISPHKKNVAVKIIKYEDAWHVEESVWPVLRHRNILPLLEIIDVEPMHFKLYVMPRLRYVLDKVLCSRRFLADSNGFVKVKRWLADSLNGLHYLHNTGLAHTDIKTDNILIASDGRAVLFDFSGLTHTGEPLKRLVAPLVYRPPDFYDPARHENLEGCACDVWLYGMMCLNVLTGDWPTDQMKPVTDAQSWKMNVEPVVIQSLQRTVFCNLVMKAFPAVAFTENELHLAHEFVVFMMKWNQEDRPSVQKIKGHPFLSTGTEVDEKTTEKSSPEEEKHLSRNPFLDGCKDSKMTIEKDIVKKVPMTECAEKKISTEKHHGSPDIQRSKDIPDYPESGKNLPGKVKDWFKMKWKKTFQKPNRYKRLKEELE